MFLISVLNASVKFFVKHSDIIDPNMPSVNPGIKRKPCAVANELHKISDWSSFESNGVWAIFYAFPSQTDNINSKLWRHCIGCVVRLK